MENSKNTIYNAFFEKSVDNLIVNAIHNGDIKRVKKIVKEYNYIPIPDVVFLEAVKSKNLGIIKFFVEKCFFSIFLSKKKEEILLIPLFNEDLKTIRYFAKELLLNYQNLSLETFKNLISEKRNKTIFLLLEDINLQLNFSEKDIIETLLHSNNEEVLRYFLFKNKFNPFSLHPYFRNGNIAIYLVCHGAWQEEFDNIIKLSDIYKNRYCLKNKNFVTNFLKYSKNEKIKNILFSYASLQEVK